MWYYEKQGPQGVEQVGPIADGEFLQLAFENKIDRTSRVKHAQHTKDEWVPAEQVPAYAQRRKQAEDDDRRRVEQTKREQESEREESVESTQDWIPGPADSAQLGDSAADGTEVKREPVWAKPKAASSGGWGLGKGCRCFVMTLLVLGGIVAAACGGWLYLGESGSGDPDTTDVDLDDLEELDIDLGSDN